MQTKYKNRKVAILTNMVAPYRVPFFKSLAENDAIAKLTILTCVERESDREWEVTNDESYKVKRLSGFTLNLNKGGDAKRILHFRFGIFLYLLFHRPSILVIGDASWTSYLAVLACKLFVIPYVVWSEITTTSKVAGGIVAKLRQIMYRYAKNIIASCQMAKDFLIVNGVPEAKIDIVNNAVDNEFFLAQKVKWQPKRHAIRAELNIAEEAFCFIYVGQLISRKRVIETVELLARASKKRSIHLIVAGNGPLEKQMQLKAESMGFNSISFCGYAQPERLCQLYTASDALILLSDDEPWGMVVNEALLMGLPYFVSDSVAAGIEFCGKCSVNVVCNYSQNDIYKLLVDFLSHDEHPIKISFSYTSLDMSVEFLSCLTL